MCSVIKIALEFAVTGVQHQVPSAVLKALDRVMFTAAYNYTIFFFLNFQRALRISVEVVHAKTGVLCQLIDGVLKLLHIALAFCIAKVYHVHFFKRKGKNRTAERIQFAVITFHIELIQPIKEAASDFFLNAISCFVCKCYFRVINSHIQNLLF